MFTQLFARKLKIHYLWLIVLSISPTNAALVPEQAPAGVEEQNEQASQSNFNNPPHWPTCSQEDIDELVRLCEDAPRRTAEAVAKVKAELAAIEHTVQQRQREVEQAQL